MRSREAAARRRLKAGLSPARYRHTLGVSRLAESLARRHGADPDKARWAGLLHDWAKEMPGKALAAYARRHRLEAPGMDFIFRNKAFSLLHAHVSAHRARMEYRVLDKACLRAMERHTLGHDDMSRLDKILYVSDLAAPDRAFPEARRLRGLARKNLDRAFEECVRLKIYYTLSEGKALHPQTISLWNTLARRKEI